MDFDDTHRAFLQALFARSTLTFADAQAILAAILSAHEQRPVQPADIRQADLDSYIHTIDAQISAYDYKIRSIVPQTSRAPGSTTTDGDVGGSSARQRVYALVNTTSDPATQLATHHKPDEIAYVKRLLDEMFERNNTPSREVMAVTPIQALHVARPRRESAVHADGTQDATQAASAGITKTQAEALLRSLVDEGWLVRDSGLYTLSPRSLMELRDWLRETYNEPPGDDDDDEPYERIKSCHACRELITMGQRCADRDCKVRMHEHCLAAAFRNQDPKCPLCSTPWTGRDFVGPRAAKARESGVGHAEHDRRRESLDLDD